MTESQLEEMPCFLRPQQSEYTVGLVEHAKNFTCAALSLASVEGPLTSRIQGSPVPNQTQWSQIPKFKRGFNLRGSGASSVVCSAVLLEALPQIVYPPHPKFDPVLTNHMDKIVTRLQTVPQTLAKERRKKIAVAKITKKKTDRRRHSQIWAKSQGNTIWNSVNDYRYRPSFGGVRL